MTPTLATAMQVHPRLRTIEWRRVALLGLGGLTMGGGLAAFAIWQIYLGYPSPHPGQLIFAALAAFMAAVVGAGTWREQRVSLNRLKLAESLANDGVPTIVNVMASRKDENGFRVMFRYTFRTAAGAQYEAAIAVAEGGAYRVDESETKSLALLSRDGRQVLLLTRSGYPLLNAAEALARASASAR